MTSQQIIDLARQLSFYTDTTEYSNTLALTDLNNVYRQLISEINQDVNEDLFADDFYADSVLGQLEYSLPTTNNNKPGLDSLLGVFINYETPLLGTGTISTTIGGNVITGVGTNFTSDFKVGYHIIIGNSFYRVVSINSNTSINIIPVCYELPTSNQSGLSYYFHKVNYINCKPQRLSNLDQDQTYYLTNQPKESPFYIKYSTGVRIFPQASESIVGAIKLYGTLDVLDLVLTDTPILSDNWHYVLAIGMKKYAYQRRGMFNEMNNAISEYEMEYKRVINTLSDSELSPLQRNIPDLLELQ